MRKIVLLYILITSIWITAKADEKTDTVAKFRSPEYVEVKSSDDSLQVKVNGMKYTGEYDYEYNYTIDNQSTDWEVNLPFLKNRSDRPKNNGQRCRLSVEWCDYFYVGGIIGTETPEGMRKGWEIGIDNLVGLYWHVGRRGPVFSLGFGMGYRSTNFGNGYMLEQDVKRLVITPVGETIGSASSRLHLFHLSVPLMINQRICSGLHLRVGGILNLNTYTSATTKIKTSGTTSKKSFHSLEQRFATPDIFGSLIFCDEIGVYVRYSPVELFKKEWGPQYKVMSVGVNFIF